MPTLTEMDQQIAARRQDFEAAIRSGVEIPTVSMDPDRRGDIRRGAEWAAGLLRDFGAEARIVETPGHPVVHGRLATPGAKRSLAIYNHLDVQPANEPEWRSDPFKLVVDGERYIGRGATDDKGPALTALFAAAMAREAGVPLDIHFFWEFEEEIGSPHFETFLQSAPRVDSVLVSDTIWISRGKPAAPLGLRGMQTVRLVLRTGTNDAHSGLTGGPARNPVAEMCDLVAALCDAHTGEVKIPGFYDEVRQTTAEEIEGFLASGFDPKEFQRVHGFRSLRYTEAADITRRIWALPTLEVHGIAGGYQGPGVKSVIPPWAEAKLSMRLVPDMTPQRALARLTSFVVAANPDVEIHAEAALEPYLAPSGGPYVAALERAMSEGFGAEPAFVREGGSIGAVVQMQRALGCPVMFLGLSLPEHGYHAPNEFFDWQMAAGGMKAFLAYFREVAAL
ncbi:MAG: M20/M25/M40 family metallo-hydrolase [Candidatus Sericytochromatia bacterium]|nr:M20/M25/M40 family metallo-hydrolase [Candidatus Tanganyikabacteria bacterium]